MISDPDCCGRGLRFNLHPSQMFTVNYGLLICSVSTFGNKSINVGDKLDLFTMDFYMPISFDASLFLILA